MTYSKDRIDNLLVLSALTMAEISLNIKPVVEGKPNAVIRKTALKSVKKAIKIMNNRLDEVTSAISSESQKDY